MNIKGISKAKVLAALYNASKVQGMGWLQAQEGEMTEEAAQAIIDDAQNLYFDYLHGRVMKIDLSKDELNTVLYNRDNGHVAAEIALTNAGLICK
jgi:hypothetical protein